MDVGFGISWKQRGDYSPKGSKLTSPARVGNKGLPKSGTMPKNSTIAAGFDFPAQKGDKGAGLATPPGQSQKEPPIRD